MEGNISILDMQKKTKTIQWISNNFSALWEFCFWFYETCKEILQALTAEYYSNNPKKILIMFNQDRERLFEIILGVLTSLPKASSAGWKKQTSSTCSARRRKKEILFGIIIYWKIIYELKMKPWRSEDQHRTIRWWTRSNQRSNLQHCQHQRCRLLSKRDFYLAKEKVQI